jgi:hypothetical protein
MNNQAMMALLRQFLALFGGLAVGAGWLSSGAEATLVTDIMTIIGAIGAFVSAGSILWSAYSNWKMKKVPEKSVALVLPPGPKPPVIGDVIDLTPMKGLAKVVG